jgi:phosphonate transport system substrate-binding protein
MTPTDRRRLLAAGALAAALPLRTASAVEVLDIGLVPYLSARAMVGLFEPLRLHLATRLRRTVRLYTAADFRALADHARDGAYPLALLPAHLTRIAVEDWRHVLVARSDLVSEVQLIARRGAEPALPDGLRGQRIAVIDPLSLTVLALHHWLARQGLAAGRDLELVHLRTVGSAAIAVRRGDAVALAGAIGQLRDFGIEPDSDLVTIAAIETIPTPAFVAHPSVPPLEVAAWRQALLAFEPPTGLAGGLSRQRFVAASLSDFDGVARYSARARELLAQPREAPTVTKKRRD